MNFRFPKSEKLKSKKTIELLFAEGISISKYPVKVFYLPSNNVKKTQAAFALGLTLFVMTLILNFIALRAVNKYREKYD